MGLNITRKENDILRKMQFSTQCWLIYSYCRLLTYRVSLFGTALGRVALFFFNPIGCGDGFSISSVFLTLKNINQTLELWRSVLSPSVRTFMGRVYPTFVSNILHQGEYCERAIYFNDAFHSKNTVESIFHKGEWKIKKHEKTLTK